MLCACGTTPHLQSATGSSIIAPSCCYTREIYSSQLLTVVSDHCVRPLFATWPFCTDRACDGWTSYSRSEGPRTVAQPGASQTFILNLSTWRVIKLFPSAWWTKSEEMLHWVEARWMKPWLLSHSLDHQPVLVAARPHSHVHRPLIRLWHMHAKVHRKVTVNESQTRLLHLLSFSLLHGLFCVWWARD